MVLEVRSLVVVAGVVVSSSLEVVAAAVEVVVQLFLVENKLIEMTSVAVEDNTALTVVVVGVDVGSNCDHPFEDYSTIAAMVAAVVAVQAAVENKSCLSTGDKLLALMEAAVDQCKNLHHCR